MATIARILVVLLALAVAGQAIVLWSATGRAGFTRFRDPEQAPTAAHDPLDDILADAGLEHDTGPMPERENAFALGLLPAGADAHAVSVLTIAGPALACAAVACIPRRRKKHGA